MVKGELDGLILGALQSEPAHGYEIVKRLKALSDGVLSVGEARLYPCLHRLEDEGCIVAEWVPQEGKPSRKVYSLTPQGGKRLADTREKWAKLSSAIGNVLAAKETN